MCAPCLFLHALTAQHTIRGACVYASRRKERAACVCVSHLIVKKRGATHKRMRASCLGGRCTCIDRRRGAARDEPLLVSSPLAHQMSAPVS